MFIAVIALKDKLQRIWFLEKTFLVADISIKMILEMPFLSHGNTYVEFAKIEGLI